MDHIEHLPKQLIQKTKSVEGHTKSKQYPLHRCENNIQGHNDNTLN